MVPADDGPSHRLRDGPRGRYICAVCGATCEADVPRCWSCESTVVVSVTDRRVYETILPMCGSCSAVGPEIGGRVSGARRSVDTGGRRSLESTVRRVVVDLSRSVVRRSRTLATTVFQNR